ncbi:hypothetical protein LCGC14_0067510 [marine sediment metagenome]|uniref:DUF5667 domain-containing protein n=1 Tax=marine sediment metagenome TaxID=412755 RepID=A0A0F9Y3F0_9ZZZZ|nr:hypothetical protein [Maribacter sp.]HDZ05545.1 hypothetical protein [Maribacter sp.]HEA81653.1 hypothetical protein [Maribacter sp.]
MEQDLRDMFKKDRESKKYTIKQGHEERFLERLEQSALENKNQTSIWYKIAASIVIIISIGFGFNYLNTVDNSTPTVVDNSIIDNKKAEFTFGDLSPDLKKVESYYVANINMELAKLEVSPDTKELIDSFMEQLNNLNLEYKTLNTELKDLGPNDQTITALIENLQLRLQLLQKLKRKLNELKLSKNEQIIDNSI